MHCDPAAGGDETAAFVARIGETPLQSIERKEGEGRAETNRHAGRRDSQVVST
jgi:hypothetical protein